MSDETQSSSPADDAAETPAESSPETPPETPPEGKTSDQVLGDAAQLQKESADDHHTPGTVVLTLIFLLTFAIYYFANWKALADVWHVR